MVVSIYKGQCEILVEGWYSSAITRGSNSVNRHQMLVFTFCPSCKATLPHHHSQNLIIN